MFNFKDKKAKRGIVGVIVALLVLCMVIPLLSGLLR